MRGMISIEAFRGGSTAVLTGADITVDPKVARAWDVYPGGPGLAVLLPDARRFQPGGPMLYILNNGPDSLDIKDNSGNIIVSPALDAGQWACVALVDNSTRNGLWGFQYKYFARS